MYSVNDLAVRRCASEVSIFAMINNGIIFGILFDGSWRVPRGEVDRIEGLTLNSAVVGPSNHNGRLTPNFDQQQSTEYDAKSQMQPLNNANAFGTVFKKCQCCGK